jgi:hypothetical protein
MVAVDLIVVAALAVLVLVIALGSLAVVSFAR